VERLPFFEGNRYPSRYGVMLMACVAPLAAIGLRKFPSKKTQSGTPAPERSASAGASIRNAKYLYLSLVALLLMALLFEHLSIPVPLSDLRVPGLYERVAAESGDFAYWKSR
jgi:hypothetical protein